MPKSRIILALGFWIALLPLLGFPRTWNSFFEMASGLLIVLLSVLISVDRRLTLKAKAEKRQARKRALVKATLAEVDPDNFGRRASDHTSAAPFGRRAADRHLPVRDAEAEERAEDFSDTAF